jgi:hypothetical protein
MYDAPKTVNVTAYDLTDALRLFKTDANLGKAHLCDVAVEGW